MAYTSVEIIALIVIIASAIKMLMLLVNPKGWMNFAKKIYAKPELVSIVALILAAIVLYYLVGAGITIIQILAITAFVALLVLIGIAKDVPALMKKYEGMVKKGNLWKEYWLYALIWIVLLIWGAKELFM
jgi:uncharacterized YccA/Bax inhibitor family protein|tara:strand:- start:2466 stop:2855 length:390 start_codon:yes stop_codon:yes gene_type:complete